MPEGLATLGVDEAGLSCFRTRPFVEMASSRSKAVGCSIDLLEGVVEIVEHPLRLVFRRTARDVGRIWRGNTGLGQHLAHQPVEGAPALGFSLLVAGQSTTQHCGGHLGRDGGSRGSKSSAASASARRTIRSCARFGSAR